MTESNIKDVLIIPMEWIWAKRSTRGGRFNDKAEVYHNQMNKLRLLIWPNKERIIESLLNGKYQINFFYEMSESWSLKKKQKYALQFKTTKPDIDNVFKFFTDTIFYKTKYNDSAIGLVSQVSKSVLTRFHKKSVTFISKYSSSIAIHV